MSRKSRLTQKEIGVMRELRASGAELHEVADLWGVTPQYVRKLTRDLRPDREGRRMHWLTREEILKLLEAWRPALPTEGLPLPNWIVRRGIGRFRWSKSGSSQAGKAKENNSHHLAAKGGTET